MARRDQRVLRPVFPNVGIAVAYRKKIMRLLERMQNSYGYWVRACYRANEPVMLAMDERARTDQAYSYEQITTVVPESRPMAGDAQTVSRIIWLAMDATPAKELQKAVADLGLRWEKEWDAAAPELAKFFAQSVRKQSQAQLRRILKDAGISVEFKMTRAARDVIDATVAENVSLIKSIPQQFHTQVEGLVMRSVVAGRDLATLTRDLRKQFAVSNRRAALIARDQNNKSTAAIMRVRQQEVGIDEAVWLHSHGGKEPRPTHLANSGKRYKVSEGWFDPDPKVRRRTWPGAEINCRCVSKPVVKGFS